MRQQFTMLIPTEYTISNNRATVTLTDYSEVPF